jgi:recombination protein RecR
MTSLEKLIKHFEQFPGIGSRQARRFAEHLLTSESETVRELSELILNIKSAVSECDSCHRFFTKNGGANICSICIDPMRDHSKLTVVAQDSDIQAIERSGVYDGLYFVLGGTVPLLDSDEAKKLRGGTLKRTVEERKGDLSEIILAFAVNPDGENTSRFVTSILRDSIEANNIKISELGR